MMVLTNKQDTLRYHADVALYRGLGNDSVVLEWQRQLFRALKAR
jgi:hypothetical protein